MNVQKKSSKLVKPVTPTPLNLNNYKISFLDSLQVPMNLAVILFYESKPKSNLLLEESLAKTLVQFYPLAGRFIREHNSIDCSDEGAEFVEAEALGLDLVSKIRIDEVKDLLPDQYFRVDEAASHPLLSIQATHFACGGAAVAISISHRVFDVASLSTFISAWSTAASSPDKTVGAELLSPSFDLPMFLPCKDDDFVAVPNQNFTNGDNIVSKKLVFDNLTLASLKSKIGPRNRKPVSGVRAACAVIAKALIRLDRGSHHGRGFRVFQAVDMRGRTRVPVPEHACGNFSFPSLSRRVDESEAESIGIRELAELIGESVRGSIGDIADVASGDRDGLKKVDEAFMDPEDTYFITFSDWSKSGFYEADFGWGKPVWTGIGPANPPDNVTAVMSNKEGDGIEAWLHLKHSDMLRFEQHWEYINQIIYN